MQLDKHLQRSATTTGVTVHFVDEGMDTGPIIEQEAVTVDENDTKENLEEKIHAVEHKLYPAVLQKLFQEEKRLLYKSISQKRSRSIYRIMIFLII